MACNVDVGLMVNGAGQRPSALPLVRSISQIPRCWVWHQDFAVFSALHHIPSQGCRPSTTSCHGVVSPPLHLVTVLSALHHITWLLTCSRPCLYQMFALDHKYRTLMCEVVLDNKRESPSHLEVFRSTVPQLFIRASSSRSRHDLICLLNTHVSCLVDRWFVFSLVCAVLWARIDNKTAL